MSGKRNGRPVFAISAKSRQITRSDTLSGFLILPANQNEPWAKGACAVSQINQAGGHALPEGGQMNAAALKDAYVDLVVSRCSQGLLQPFQCAVCGVMALDPIGWNGHRQPLCGFCADSLERRKE
jgi:hypothetical protein